MHYPTSEHLYIALKTDDLEDRRKISLLPTPQEAKKYGQSVRLIFDWNNLRYPMMYKACWLKFYQNLDLWKLLDATGDKRLEETNDWDDRFWGVVDGSGLNNLGNVLMEVRTNYRLKI